jgi:outer membrane protein W
LTLQAQQTLTGFRVYQRCAARTPWLKRGACRGAFRSSSAGLADQGDILVRARVIDIAPQVSTTGTLSSLGIGVDGQIVPELAFTYMLTNNIGLSSSLA